MYCVNVIIGINRTKWKFVLGGFKSSCIMYTVKWNAVRLPSFAEPCLDVNAH